MQIAKSVCVVSFWVIIAVYTLSGMLVMSCLSDYARDVRDCRENWSGMLVYKTIVALQ